MINVIAAALSASQLVWSAMRHDAPTASIWAFSAVLWALLALRETR